MVENFLNPQFHIIYSHTHIDYYYNFFGIIWPFAGFFGRNYVNGIYTFLLCKNDHIN